MNGNTRFLERLRLRENQLFLVATVLIGILAGLAAVLFTLSIEAAQWAFFGLNPSKPRLLLIPAGVSVLTGFLLAKVFPGVRGSGVPQTEVAFHLEEGRIPGRVPIGKFLTGVLCIGSGHSMGREGPSVQIGAGIGSVVGRWLGLPKAQLKSLIPLSAAAALAAAFNTPVAAVLFALEEIIGDMNASLIGASVVASVTSVIVERSILGNQPVFRVPPYQLVHPAELGAYAILGLVGGGISLVFCKGLLHLRSLFRKLPSATIIFQPAIGGILVGAILVFFPQVMGVGYQYVDQALSGSFPLKLMAMLCAVKLAATVISYSSGNAGGIFAPSLYLGAMAGGTVGLLVHRFAPFPTAAPGAYALVGMGTLFAGIIRAPMTSVFMIFELTQDYQILVPLMVANMISFAVSRHFQPKPIYHALLEQDGIHLPGAETKLAAGTWSARDIMSREFTLIPSSQTVEQALKMMNHSEAALTGAGGRMDGLVMRTALQKAVDSGHGNLPVKEILSGEAWPHVHPDHSLDLVLERLRNGPGILPVVSRSDTARVEGVIDEDSFGRLFFAGQSQTAAGQSGYA